MAEPDDSLRAEAEAMRPPSRPTEGVVGPVVMALRRSWPHDKRPADGSWYACLDVGPIERAWTCDLVIEKVNPDYYTW